MERWDPPAARDSELQSRLDRDGELRSRLDRVQFLDWNAGIRQLHAMVSYKIFSLSGLRCVRKDVEDYVFRGAD